MSLPPNFLSRFFSGSFGLVLGIAVGLPAHAQEILGIQETQTLAEPQIGADVAPLVGETDLFDVFAQPLDAATPGLRGDISPAATLVLDPPLVGTGVPGRAAFPAGPAPAGQRARAGQAVTGDFDADLVDIRQRQRPELDALGLKAGGFTFFPQVQTRAVFTDNVTRSLTNKKSDMLYAVSPSLRAVSNWGRHAVSLQYSGDYGTYLKTKAERIESTNLVARAQIDISRADQLVLRASFANDLEERDNVDVTAATTSPGTVTRYEARADYQHRFNRLSALLRGTYAIEKYGESQVAGSAQDNSDRDFTDAQAGLRLSYEVSPAARVFVDGEFDQRTYTHVATGALDRTSTGWRGAVGLRLAPIRRLRGEVSLGYLHRDYREAQLAPVDGLVLDANLAWLATPLTTIVASAGVEVDETTLAGASGVITRRLGVGVAHELLRSVIVSADLGYERESYEGLDRANSKIIATLGANYQLSRYAALTLTGVYEEEVERQGEGNYLENTLTLGLVLRR
ncbi:MAG: outer membrane beta-barrel protein [Alphaproteobacteria bacterium]